MAISVTDELSLHDQKPNLSPQWENHAGRINHFLWY